MLNRPNVIVECAQAATKNIARKCGENFYTIPQLFFFASILALLGACTMPVPAPEAAAALPFYRCEHGIQFTAKFTGDAVTLDSSRGYEVLFRGDKNTHNAKNPNEYGNPRMSAEFKQGSTGKEALLRYPLLPLVARCVQD